MIFENVEEFLIIKEDVFKCSCGANIKDTIRVYSFESETKEVDFNELDCVKNRWDNCQQCFTGNAIKNIKITLSNFVVVKVKYPNNGRTPTCWGSLSYYDLELILIADKDHIYLKQENIWMCFYKDRKKCEKIALSLINPWIMIFKVKTKSIEENQKNYNYYQSSYYYYDYSQPMSYEFNQRRNKDGINGFQNIGSTCYLNSSLQALRPCLLPLLENGKELNEFEKVLLQLYSGESKEGLFIDMLEKEFKKEFRKQSDSLTFIVDYLFKVLSPEFLAHFEIKIISKFLKCKNCGFEQEKKFDAKSFFLSLFSEKGTIEDRINNIIFIEEQCPECSKILTKKQNLRFPDFLMLKPLSDTEKQIHVNLLIKIDDHQFEMVGLVYHTGSFSFGHYKAEIKWKGSFYSIDDSYVEKISNKTSLYHLNPHRPALIIYKKINPPTISKTLKKEQLKIVLDEPEQNIIKNSRQIYCLGGENSLKLLEKSKILLIGLNHLTLEILKNLLLLGAKNITIHPKLLNNQEDLIFGDKLKSMYEEYSKLNPNASIQIVEQFDEFPIAKFDIFVSNNFHLYHESLQNVSKILRGIKKDFIFANVTGSTFAYYLNYGNDYQYRDIYGNAKKDVVSYKVSNFSSSGYKYYCKLDFEDGFVDFESGDRFKIISTNSHFKDLVFYYEGIDNNILTFYLLTKELISIEKLNKEDYVSINKLAKTEKMDFVTFPQWLDNEFESSYKDYIRKKGTASENKYLETFIMKLIYKYVKLDPEDFIKNIKKEMAYYDIQLNDSILLFISKGRELSNYYIQPLYSFAGSVISQEIIKCLTKSIKPSDGHIFSFIDTFSFEYLQAKEQSKIHDKCLENTLKKLNILLVGAGATGSEVLKNLAMMEVGQDTKHGVIVVDDDLISESNLTRQMFYGKEDIGKSKSITICQNIKKIHSSFKATPIKGRVEKSDFNHQNFYNHDSFWSDIDVIISAVDNKNSRVILTEYSTYYNIPLLNMGTDSLGGTSSTYIPSQSQPIFTEYTTTNTSKSCTGKTFPFISDQTIEWSLDVFNTLFIQNIKDVMSYINSNCPEDVSEKLKTISTLYRNIFQKRYLNTINLFIIYIYKEFFHDNLIQIIKTTKDEEYSEIKRKPIIIELNNFKNSKEFLELVNHFFKMMDSKTPIEFMKDDIHHLNFIKVISNMRCENFRIIPIDNLQEIQYKVAEIIPAIITSSSAMSALSCLELIKLAQRKLGITKDLQFKNSSFDLGKNFNFSRTDLCSCHFHPHYRILPKGTTFTSLFAALDKHLTGRNKYQVIYRSKEIYKSFSNYDDSYLDLSIHELIYSLPTNNEIKEESLRFDIKIINEKDGIEKELDFFFQYLLKDFKM